MATKSSYIFALVCCTPVDETVSVSSTSGEYESSTSSSTTNPPTSSTTNLANCGDGIVNQISEECEGNEGCKNCLLDRIAFVTSKNFTGNLGGIEGTDKICNGIIESTNNILLHNRKMKAWLSDNTQVAGEFDLGEGRYFRLDGRLIADSGPDLKHKNLENSIFVDENGNILTNFVWTNTDNNGIIIDQKDHCKNWTYDGNFERTWVGSSSSKEGWSKIDLGMLNPVPCSNFYHLYCVEVK